MKRLGIHKVWCFLFVCFIEKSHFLNGEIHALDGFGHPVAWWAILKLPMHAHDPNNGHTFPTPCKCSSPQCHQANSKTKMAEDRAKGLCYLYADANHPSFVYFEEKGYDCLGQGGNDPLSHTLRQMHPPSPQKTKEKSIFWAYFNDQFNGIAQGKNHSNVCNAGNSFSAHAKGAVAFDLIDGGFFLQTSTPNYPDPSFRNMNTTSSSSMMIPLGCQEDNNVLFAQHFFAMSLEMKEMEKLGASLQVARLCSANYYTSQLKKQLVSSNFYQLIDNSSLARALLDKNLFTFNDSKETILNLKNSQDKVQTLVKSPHVHLPPWALVSHQLETDMSVATWWDQGYGIPNVCAGDDYTKAKNHFCLNSSNSIDKVTTQQLYPNGTAQYNVENLLEAKYTTKDKKEIAWHLLGGRVTDGNHAKWGLSTPRHGTEYYVTFGDLNMQGFPCSSTCFGSQGGRGGSFFSLSNPQLHASLSEMVILKACPCGPPPPPPKYTTTTTTQQEEDNRMMYQFKQLRMCGHGCQNKMDKYFTSQDLPQLSPLASSYWTKISDAIKHQEKEKQKQSTFLMEIA